MMTQRAPPDARTLGFFSLLALGINGIVGVGIFFAPAKVAAEVPGMAGSLVYLLTALALVPVACAYATLGGHFDEDGGPYVWARAGFGPAVGFAVGWMTYVSALFSASAVVSGFSGYLASSLGLAGPWGARFLAAGCVIVLGGVAATGLRPSAIAWNTVTVLKLIPLLLLAALFVSATGLAAPHSVAAHPGFAQVGQAALIVVFATQGFEIVPVPAGNARRSQRAVPAATLLSLALVVMLYLVLHSACVQALPGLADSAAPLVDAARVYGGPPAAGLVAIGTGVSAVGIAFGMFAMTPRYLSVLGRPEAFGAWIGAEDVKRHVPRRALAVTAVGVMVLVVLADLADLFVLSSVAVLVQYGVTAASLVVLAWRRVKGLSRRQLWPAPLALGAIALIGQSAKPYQLLVATAVLVVGVLFLVARRLLVSRARQS